MTGGDIAPVAYLKLTQVHLEQKHTVSARDMPAPALCYRTAENFAGAKFRGIASESARRNFRGFNFRGARTHGEVRCYRYSARGSRPIDENREIFHHAKISRYTVCVCKVCCVHGIRYDTNTNPPYISLPPNLVSLSLSADCPKTSPTSAWL